MDAMSEKKAPDNKRDKEKMLHVTEEQIQAGKAEIMKIVAGANGAEKLADLLEKASVPADATVVPVRKRMAIITTASVRLNICFI